MTIMEQTLSTDGGPSTDELDCAQWAHQYDDGTPSFITDQSTSTLTSIEAAEAALLMFQNGADGTYAGPGIEEYEWNGRGESGIGDNFNDNPFQRNGYDWNEWNDNLPEDREEDFDGSSLLGSPHEELTSDTSDVL